MAFETVKSHKRVIKVHVVNQQGTASPILIPIDSILEVRLGSEHTVIEYKAHMIKTVCVIESIDAIETMINYD